MRWDHLLIWLDGLSPKGKRRRETNLNHCLNCGHTLSDDIFYCPNCGQKKRITKVTVWSLLGEVFSDLLNLDNGIWRSLRYVFIPAHLAREFIEGRRKKYFNPIRFFLLSLILLFAIISYVADMDDFDIMTERQHKRIALSEIKEEFLEFIDSSDYEAEQLILADTIEEAIFEEVKIAREDTFDINLNLIGVDMSKYGFTRRDIYEMEIDELLTHYNVETFKERFIVTQYARTARDLSGAVQFAIGNMIWGIVSSIFLLALFMKLLYIRRNIYYVEHLVVLFNIHTFSFLLLAPAVLIGSRYPEETADMIAAPVFLVSIIYSFLTYKKYYKQGFIKTAIKFILSGSFYLIALVSMVVVVFLASMLLFK
jgi:hypothetical protein